MTDIRFLEIEHKYLLPQDYNPQPFIQIVKDLEPHGESIVEVNDSYFVTKSCPGYVFRHRIDKEIQHLTVKSLGDDPTVRKEVNLDLGHHKGDQKDRAKAFLEALTITWHGTIHKSVCAYYFHNCEVTYYEAHYGNRSVKCIEIEATQASSIDEAKGVISEFERKLQLDPDDRENQSLFQMLLLPDIPPS